MTKATEIALTIPDTTDMEASQADVVSLAEAFEVFDQDSLDVAAIVAKNCKKGMDAVDELFGPPVKKAHEAHKATKLVWNTLTRPYQTAYDIYRNKMAVYSAEQDRKAREEHQRIEREAREVEEKRVADEAEQLAKEDRVEEAVALVNRPITVAVAAPVKTKAVGMSTRENWKFHVVDLDKIPRRYMVVNEGEIGHVVRTHHKAAEKMIPGIEAYPETSASVRS